VQLKSCQVQHVDLHYQVRGGVEVRAREIVARERARRWGI
jgi:hypothetical protein